MMLFDPQTSGGLLWALVLIALTNFGKAKIRAKCMGDRQAVEKPGIEII